MMLLEYQHRSQPDCRGSTATKIDTDRLCLFQNLVSSWGIKGNKRSLTLSSQIDNLLWILAGQLLQLAVHIISSGRRIGHEIKTFDFFNDALEKNGASWITHPRVELAISFVGTELRIAKVVACCLGLFGKRHHVRRFRQIPVIVGPEFARGTETGLNFVDN